jgi:hypothetical protein
MRRNAAPCVVHCGVLSQLMLVRTRLQLVLVLLVLEVYLLSSTRHGTRLQPFHPGLQDGTEVP